MQPPPPPPPYDCGAQPALLFPATLSYRVNKLDGMCRQKDLMLHNAVQSHKGTELSLEEERSAAEKTIVEKERVVAELQAALRQQAEEAAEEVER